MHKAACILILALVLAGCNSSSSSTPENNTYTVFTTVSDGGTINPAAASVQHGNSTSFEITPDDDHTIESVTGCGGSLTGNTYYTGPVTSNCTVSVSFKSELYTKLDEKGKPLPDSATSWSCIKDHKTGLIWEEKTDDDGLRDWNHIYSWYNPDPATNGGYDGRKDGGDCTESECDTYAYTQAVNDKTLCGIAGWRLPTIDELNTLVYCSSGEREDLHHEGSSGACIGKYERPTINTNFFANTSESSWFWSASSHAYKAEKAWFLDFGNGSVNDNFFKIYNGKIRLVHDGL
ncbi:uncharacterized protein DUF1566 [Desulfobotulus alkaliphilus]|uniref:Uncharacterized protein DUF1566 n=1 Tax=Desulfobotulus alkaliphilus TaxID=622671 RepID=A0A562QYF7_9BACT|nr:DUF1566 domain-containing protein [Desulfobotulus alkaliphilus]TWI61354.1 uncharacterized protein DUF1566 [Desulfobotulus alkaliphilus]